MCFIRTAYATAGIAAVALLAFLTVSGEPWVRQHWRIWPSALRQSYNGFVTDTFCAGHHHILGNGAECVRTCARHPGTKYALYSGNKTYVISDQAAGEKFAGRDVVITGSIDQNTGVLMVASIQSR